jgi:hypothetical protein
MVDNSRKTTPNLSNLWRLLHIRADTVDDPPDFLDVQKSIQQ